MFEQFPYANFHELNMDWIIKIAKDFLDQYTNIQDTITTGLDSLGDKAEELEALLQAWYDTHSEDIAQQLTQAVIDFNQAAEQKGLEVIQSIPADYTEVERVANTVRENLIRYNTGNLFNLQKTYTFNQSAYGVSIVYDPIEDVFTLNGTSTGEGNVNLYNDSAVIPEGLIPGQPYIFRVTKTNASVKVEDFFYVNGSWAQDMIINPAWRQGQKLIPTNATGMLIRFQMPNNTTFTNAKLKIELFKDAYAKYNGVTAYTAIADNVISDPAAIEYYLAHNDRTCFLESGTHKINRSINMSYGSRLIGCNFNSSVLTATENTFDLITIQNTARTYISNIHLQGLVSNIGDNPIGFGCGIRVIGDDSVNYPRYNIIENCQIHGFQGGGIVLENNSYWVAHSVTITNCEIWRNYAGIWTKPKAEYNRISNCLIYSNYIGILNNGGNNTFINCDLTENQVAFYIDTAAATNDGHGSIIGCTCNHNNNNQGYAFILRDVENGFLINGCNIWYGKIIVSGSRGILFSNCLLGKAASPALVGDDNTSVVFSSCMFYATPTIGGNTPPVLVNCRAFDGTVL